MKDGVIVVNTSRGPIIKEVDLIEALNSGKVQTAGLDVLEQEPPDPQNPLLFMPMWSSPPPTFASASTPHASHRKTPRGPRGLAWCCAAAGP